MSRFDRGVGGIGCASAALAGCVLLVAGGAGALGVVLALVVWTYRALGG